MEVSDENNQLLISQLSNEDNVPGNRKLAFDDLSEYLKKLNNWMKLKTSTNVILEELPSVGRLLLHASKFYKNYSKAIDLLDGSLSDVLTDCIISFSNFPNSLRDGSVIQTKKVNQLAAELLQVCTLSHIKEDDARLMDLFGVSQHEVVDAQVLEVTSVVSHFQPNKCIIHQKLEDISQLLLPVVDERKLKDLVESVVRLHERSLQVPRPTSAGKYSASKAFFQAVASRRNVVRGFKDETTIALWRCYPPALEFQIIDLVKIAVCRPFIDKTSLFQLVQIEGRLVCAHCCQYDEFHQCTFDTLKRCLQKLGPKPALVSLVNFLQVAGHFKQNDVVRGQITPGLFLALPVSLDGLCLEARLNVMQLMSCELRRVQDTRYTIHSKLFERSDIWFALARYKHLVDNALQLCFFCSPDHVEHSLNILCWFYFSSTQIVVKEVFKVLVTSLKDLISRTVLQMSDLEDAISRCRRAMPDNIQPMPLVYVLIFQFLIHAEASHSVTQELLTLDTSGLPIEEKFDSWLRSLELYSMDSYCFKEHFKCARNRKDKTSAFIVGIRTLSDQLKSEHFNKVDTRPSPILNIEQCLQDLLCRANKVIHFLENET